MVRKVRQGLGTSRFSRHETRQRRFPVLLSFLFLFFPLPSYKHQKADRRETGMNDADMEKFPSELGGVPGSSGLSNRSPSHRLFLSLSALVKVWRRAGLVT